MLRVNPALTDAADAAGTATAIASAVNLVRHETMLKGGDDGGVVLSGMVSTGRADPKACAINAGALALYHTKKSDRILDSMLEGTAIKDLVPSAGSAAHAMLLHAPVIMAELQHRKDLARIMLKDAPHLLFMIVCLAARAAVHNTHRAPPRERPTLLTTLPSNDRFRHAPRSTTSLLSSFDPKTATDVLNTLRGGL